MARFKQMTMKIFLFGVLISMFAASEAEENILIIPHAPNVKEGQSFKMTCKLFVNSISVFLTHDLNWKHYTGTKDELLTLRGVVVKKYQDQYKVNLTSDETTRLAMISVLEILKVAPSNNGIYTCVERQKIGDNYQTVNSVDTNIDVLVDPKFSCVNKSAILNDRYVTLECDIVANPPIKKHVWIYGDIRGVNSDIERDDDRQTYTVAKGVHKVTLTINKVTKRHFNTTFMLEVITEDDKVYSHPVKLIERFLKSSSRQHSGSGRHYQEIFLAVLLTVSALILSI